MTNKMKKKPHSPECKFKVAIEAIRDDKTTAELCQAYGIERFWRTVKYEEVYLKTYETVSEAKLCLSTYILDGIITNLAIVGLTSIGRMR